MKKSNQQQEKRGGFTLIEVLLTVTIVAFLAGSLYATFAAGLKLDRRAKQSFVDLDENRLLVEQLYKDFGRIVSYDFRGSLPDRKSFSFDGKELIFLVEKDGELQWVRYTLAAVAKGEVKETRLGIVSKRNVAVSNITNTQASLLTLVRDENDFAHFFNSADAPQKRTVLSRRVSADSLKVFFVPVLLGQPKIEWESSWDKSFLPSAVRVSVSIVSESATSQKFTRDFVLPAGGRDES